MADGGQGSDDSGLAHSYVEDRPEHETAYQMVSNMCIVCLTCYSVADRSTASTVQHPDRHQLGCLSYTYRPAYGCSCHMCTMTITIL